MLRDVTSRRMLRDVMSDVFSATLLPLKPYPPRAHPGPTWITYNNGRMECSTNDGIRKAVPSIGNLCELVSDSLESGGNDYLSFRTQARVPQSAQARVPPCISERRHFFQMNFNDFTLQRNMIFDDLPDLFVTSFGICF